MELLRGDTLRQHLRVRGALGVEEALPLVTQMAAALAAAHEAGVVHRDFKAANVMLVPSRSPGAPPRVVVTDFGLAWAGDSSTSITRSDHIVGTPAYVAPEQAEGGEVTAASDIYAFGVVLYEMMTGRLPFEGDSPLSTVLKRFREDPVSRAITCPRFTGRGTAAILRCLERDPRDRFASANDVVAALRGETVAAPMGVRSRRRVTLIAAAVAAVVAVAATGAYLWTRRPATATADRPGPAPVAASRRSVAVLGFKNLSGNAEKAWLSTALSEMLAAELAAGAKLRTVPGENVSRMKADLGLPDADAWGPTRSRASARTRARTSSCWARTSRSGRAARSGCGSTCACRTPCRARRWPRSRRPAPRPRCSTSCRAPARGCARASARETSRRPTPDRCGRASRPTRRRPGCTRKGSRACAASTRCPRSRCSSRRRRPIRASRPRTRRWPRPGPRSATTPRRSNRRGGRTKARATSRPKSAW